jgi:hypothetical protein
VKEIAEKLIELRAKATQEKLWVDTLTTYQADIKSESGIFAIVQNSSDYPSLELTEKNAEFIVGRRNSRAKG